MQALQKQEGADLPMHILMLTNTYLPLVGGVARSVESFAREYREHGHEVLIVAPRFEREKNSSSVDGLGPDEEGVVRVPAIRNFNGSPFAVRWPIPGYLTDVVQAFAPDVVHSHHPFLLGDTALRIAARQDVPLVFTHHTMYERYTHYLPGDSEFLRRFVMDLATGYANRCDLVFAPSESVARLLVERGVETPIRVIPTGVDVELFRSGDRERGRREHGLSAEARVVGHVGRLAPEKNLSFLARAVARLMADSIDVHFLVVGDGPSRRAVLDVFAERGLSNRLHLAGSLSGQALVDAYAAMDLFAFASLTETQGMVLTEALAAGLPVVAIDAPGARETVRDGRNGRLLPCEDEAEFSRALRSTLERSAEDARLRQAALETSRDFAMERIARRALEEYRELASAQGGRGPRENLWDAALRVLETEWELWAAVAHAASSALEDASVGGESSVAQE